MPGCENRERGKMTDQEKYIAIKHNEGKKKIKKKGMGQAGGRWGTEKNQAGSKEQLGGGERTVKKIGGCGK